MTDHPWFWPSVWIGYIVLGFAIETVALVRSRSGDTLSEQAWALRDYLKGRGFVGKLSLALLVINLLGFFAWLAFHFITGEV